MGEWYSTVWMYHIGLTIHFPKDIRADSFFGATNEATVKIHCACCVGMHFTASGTNAQECNCRVIW